MVKWLGLHAFTAKSQGLIPGLGTKIWKTMWCGPKEKKKKSGLKKVNISRNSIIFKTNNSKEEECSESQKRRDKHSHSRRRRRTLHRERGIYTAPCGIRVKDLWGAHGNGVNARLQRRSSSQEELPRVQGQGWWPGGATPCSRSGGVVVRRYPSSKVRSSGCTLLE